MRASSAQPPLWNQVDCLGQRHVYETKSSIINLLRCAGTLLHMGLPWVQGVPRLSRQPDPCLATLAEHSVRLDLARQWVVLNECLPILLLLDPLDGGVIDNRPICSRSVVLFRLLSGLLLGWAANLLSIDHHNSIVVVTYLSERSLIPLQDLRCSTQFFMMYRLEGLRPIHSLQALQNTRCASTSPELGSSSKN